jgi:hypothetical protein
VDIFTYRYCTVDHFSVDPLLLFLPSLLLYMAGSWVRTITSPFRKVFGAQPHKDGGKRPQQPNSGMMVQHVVVDAERSKLHGEVMACAYEDVQVMWDMLDKARIREFNSS